MHAPVIVGDSGRAHDLFIAALDRKAMLDADSARTLLYRAVANSPGYLPAQFELLGQMRYVRSARVTHDRAYTAWIARDTSAVARCLRIAGSAPAAYAAIAVPALVNLEQQTESSCAALFVALYAPTLQPALTWASRIVQYSTRAAVAGAEIPDLWIQHALARMTLGDTAAALTAIRRGLEYSGHALHRVSLFATYATLLRQAGAAPRADALTRALTMAVERDGRPGVKLVMPLYIRYDSRAIDRSNDAAFQEAVHRERVRLSASSRSPVDRWTSLRSLGLFLSDAGAPVAALEYLNAAVRIADSVASPLMLMDTYRFRGRAYVKMGHFAEAERDLRRASGIGRGSDAYILAEVFHNLAHAYEGSGQMLEAMRAADRYVQLARPFTFAQPRMMSLHDAGLIRSKAGMHAASRAAFAEMVRVVDAQQHNYFWAGEYFEREGELELARRYYRLGLLHDAGERSLNLGGLTRVHIALGALDSAESTARLHDAAMANQLDVPLLPEILAREARVAEAKSIATAWAARHAQLGNVEGAAVASNRLAQLLLSWNDPRAAVQHATAAESLARRSNLTDELTRSIMLEGRAQLALGNHDGALRLLVDATEMAEHHLNVDLQIASHVALGNALAGHGDIDQAMHAYRRAAVRVESVSGRLSEDIDRAGYRERQLAPFDGALRVLLKQPPTLATLTRLASWSSRRKAASLAVATRTGNRRVAAKSLSDFDAGSAAPQESRPDLSTIQRLIPARAAIIDYIVEDSAVYALVMTRDNASLAALPMRDDELRTLIERLVRPFQQAYAGRVDVSRLVFNDSVARTLGAVLLDPLDSLLSNVDRLLIVPDGPMNEMPFDALIVRGASETERPRFAIQRYDIAVTPTLSTSESSVRDSHQPKPRILVVTRNAPGASEERDAIVAAWSTKNVNVLDGRHATESAVRSQAGSYDIVHFATHAEADDRDPLGSHLQLGIDSLNDGFLHLSEIQSQRLRARLVLLSACSTLSGRLYAGEGVMGLARAFLIAGSRAVIATEWPVGATTAATMGTLHADLARGAHTSTALRNAKLATMRKPETSHPFFWAGFTFISADIRNWANN